MDFFNINGFNLDETQVEAIKSKHKSTLVVAGAGSGKTLTILGKVKYLIEEEKVNQDKILCISFTNESVKSLKNKLLAIGYDVDVFTFHKLSLSILEDDNYTIVENNYLEYIILEYFHSYIYHDKKNYSTLKRLLNTKDVFNSNEFVKLTNLISTFIHLAKSNDYNLSYIYKLYKRSLFSERIILKYIVEIMLVYKRELESIKKIDFDDMIILATKKIKEINIKYKYIIIDEFQDTSLVRYNLVKEIIKKNKASIFVVGDDWQSIYRFSGCNLDIFINFSKYFEDTARFDLKYTYRNSNELIYVSSSFIQKNKKQLKKNIVSLKNLTKPIKIVKNYSLDETLKLIDNDDILILGRNNYDINDINYNNKLTIHKSKGLEANNVILVNSDDIPTHVKNERLLRHVLAEKDYIIYEEERRLFYVALTRTKNSIYIIINKKISPFVKELISNYKDYIEFIIK